jgi:hypothetical protein
MVRVFGRGRRRATLFGWGGGAVQFFRVAPSENWQGASAVPDGGWQVMQGRARPFVIQIAGVRRAKLTISWRGVFCRTESSHFRSFKTRGLYFVHSAHLFKLESLRKTTLSKQRPLQKSGVMFRTALLLGVMSTPAVLGFQMPFSTRIPKSAVRSGCVSNKLKMVATPLRTDEQKPNGEEWQGTSTLDRQLVCPQLFFFVAMTLTDRVSYSVFVSTTCGMTCQDGDEHTRLETTGLICTKIRFSSIQASETYAAL